MIYQGIKPVDVRSNELKGEFLEIPVNIHPVDRDHVPTYGNLESLKIKYNFIGLKIRTWIRPGKEFKFAWFTGEKVNVLYLSKFDICSDEIIKEIVEYCEANL